MAVPSAPASDAKILASASQFPTFLSGSGFPDVFSGLIEGDSKEPQQNQSPEEQPKENVTRGELAAASFAILQTQVPANIPLSLFHFQLDFLRLQIRNVDAQTSGGTDVPTASTDQLPPQQLPATSPRAHKDATKLSDAEPQVIPTTKGQTPMAPVLLDFQIANKSTVPQWLGSTKPQALTPQVSPEQSITPNGSDPAIQEVQVPAAPLSSTAPTLAISDAPHSVRRQLETKDIRQGDQHANNSVKETPAPVESAPPVLAPLPIALTTLPSNDQSPSRSAAPPNPPAANDIPSGVKPQPPNPDRIERGSGPGTAPWKQSTERLGGSELAFAVRLVGFQQQATTAADSATASEPDTKPRNSSPPAGTISSAAGPRPGSSGVQATQTPDEARDNGPDSRSQTETASIEKPAEPPGAPRKFEVPDPVRDMRDGATAKVQRSSAEVTPAGVASVTNGPTRETEKAQQPQPAAEVHSLPDEPQAQPSQPLRDLSLRLSTAGQDQVEVKVVERAGEVRVAVRSTDPQLTSSLQQGINELTGRLESRGVQAETWRPSDNSAPHSVAQPQNSSNNQQTFPDDGSQGRRGQQEQVFPPKRRSKPDWLREIDGTFDTLHNDITRRTS